MITVVGNYQSIFFSVSQMYHHRASLISVMIIVLKKEQLLFTNYLQSKIMFITAFHAFQQSRMTKEKEQHDIINVYKNAISNF